MVIWLYWLAWRQPYEPQRSHGNTDVNNTGYLRDYLIDKRPIQKITFQTDDSRDTIATKERKRTVHYRDYVAKFNRRDLPIFAYQDFIDQEAVAHGISPKLIIAQAIVESGGCVRNAAPRNCWGCKLDSHRWHSWTTYEQAIEDQAAYTRRKLDACQERLSCYFARYAEDPQYQAKVEKIMETL